MSNNGPKAITLQNIDRMEDEIGRDGVEKLSELWRQRSYEIEAQITAAWYAATGELPEGEADHLVRKHVRTVDREAQDLEQIVRSATILERAAAPSPIMLMRKDRRQKMHQSEGGKNRRQFDPDDLQAALEAKMRERPRLSLTQARKAVAKEFGASYQTLRDNTTDPRK